MNEGDNITTEDTERKTYGNYEIVKPIGKGKFAIVYRAKRISDDLVVALKRINVDAIDQKARQKCLEEIRLLQSLDHPNIIKYMDSFITDNDLVIVVEWAAAGDLKRQLRKAQERGVGFEERVIWKYFSQICDAMKHMHDRRIMHRDLKPANIFLTLDGTVKVGDLGLSRELSEHTVQAHSKVGTPLYMSPEVLRGDGYDFKSDVWSLGCLLYELAMLKSPFKSEGLNLYSLFQKISQGDFQPLPENYSEELRSLAYSMISTRSEDRPELADICATASRMRSHLASVKKSQQGSSGGGGGGGSADTKSVGNDTSAPPSARSLRADSKSDRNEEEIGTKDDRGGRAGRGGGGGGQETGSKQLGDDDNNDDDDEDGLHPSLRRTISVTMNLDHTHDLPSPYTPSSVKINTTAAAPGKTSFPGENLSVTGQGRRHDGKEGSSSVSPRTDDDPHDLGSGGGRTTTQKEKTNTRRRPQQQQDDEDEQFVPSQSGATNGKNNNRSSAVETEKNKERDASIKPYSRIKGGGGGSSKTQTQTQTASDRRNEVAISGGNDSDDDDSDGGAAGTGNNVASGGSTVKEKLGAASVAFALMEVLYSTLIALDYPLRDASLGTETVSKGATGRGLLLPIHFACDLSLVGRVAGVDGRTQHLQFRRMVSVAVWLIQRTGATAAVSVSNIDVDRDPPLMVAKQLLSAAQSAGVAPQDLTDILPTALTVGHGEKVCTFLLALCDLARHALGHKWKPLKYEDDEAFGGGGGKKSGGGRDADDGIAEDEDMMEDSGENHAEEKDDQDDGMTDFALLESGQFGSELGASLLMPSVDPLIWREETERVAPKLAQAQKQALIAMSGGWGQHLEMMKSYKEKNLPGWGAVPAPSSSSSSSSYDKEGRDRGAAAGGGASSSSGASSSETSELLSQLTGLQRDLQESLGGLSRAERLINSKGDMQQFAEKYQEHKKHLESLQERQSVISKKVESLSGEAAEVDDKLQEVIEALEVKSGSRDGNDSTNALVRMKEGIRELKRETAEMNMRTGVLSANLLAIKAQNTKETMRQQRNKMTAKKKLRGGSGGNGGVMRGKGGGDEDGDSGALGMDLDDDQ